MATRPPLVAGSEHRERHPDQRRNSQHPHRAAGRAWRLEHRREPLERRHPTGPFEQSGHAIAIHGRFPGSPSLSHGEHGTSDRLNSSTCAGASSDRVTNPSRANTATYAGRKSNSARPTSLNAAFFIAPADERKRS